MSLKCVAFIRSPWLKLWQWGLPPPDQPQILPLVFESLEGSCSSLFKYFFYNGGRPVKIFIPLNISCISFLPDRVTRCQFALN